MRDAMLCGDTRIAQSEIVVVALTVLTNRAREIGQDADSMNDET